MMILRSLACCLVAVLLTSTYAVACSVGDVPCTRLEGDLPSVEVLSKLNIYLKGKAPSLANSRYVTLFDASAHSGTRRLYLIDLKRGTVHRHLVAHGRGSDPDHDGWASDFSDVPQSKKTPLGFFATAETYTGRHGHSLKLDGLEARNANARSRAIVIHGADYVTPTRDIMGRSWGCPALDRNVAHDVIERIKGGSLLYIYASAD